jgi:hypothetical protein
MADLSPRRGRGARPARGGPTAAPARAALIAAAVAAAAAGAPACGAPAASPCEQAFELRRRCGADGEPLPDRRAFVEACERALRGSSEPGAAEPEVACRGEATCEGYADCRARAQGSARAEAIRAAARAGRWGEAFDRCTRQPASYSDPELRAACAEVLAATARLSDAERATALYRCEPSEDRAKLAAAAPGFEAACAELGGRQLAALEAAAAARRDAGERDQGACRELIKIAEIVGGDAVARAQLRCTEIEVAAEAVAAIRQARANAAAATPEVPFRCDTALAKLVQLDSDWARRTLADVARACFAELGPVVLAALAREAQRRCPFELKRLADAASKHAAAAELPDVAAFRARLPPGCR